VRAGQPTMPSRPARTPRNLHLHDIVVEERLRGRGWGLRLLNHLTLVAGSRGFERISLIAVGRSEPFWSARGFNVYPGISPDGYGANAVYMSKAMAESTKRVDVRVPCP